MARRRPEFMPGAADAETAKLGKFSDAGRIKIQAVEILPRARMDY